MLGLSGLDPDKAYRRPPEVCPSRGRGWPLLMKDGRTRFGECASPARWRSWARWRPLALSATDAGAGHGAPDVFAPVHFESGLAGCRPPACRVRARAWPAVRCTRDPDPGCSNRTL